MRLVDIMIDDTGDNVYNRSLYLTVGIPIGSGKAKAKEKIWCPPEVSYTFDVLLFETD